MLTRSLHTSTVTVAGSKLTPAAAVVTVTIATCAGWPSKARLCCSVLPGAALGAAAAAAGFEDCWIRTELLVGPCMYGNVYPAV